MPKRKIRGFCPKDGEGLMAIHHTQILPRLYSMTSKTLPWSVCQGSLNLAVISRVCFLILRGAISQLYISNYYESISELYLIYVFFFISHSYHLFLYPWPLQCPCYLYSHLESLLWLSTTQARLYFWIHGKKNVIFLLYWVCGGKKSRTVGNAVYYADSS